MTHKEIKTTITCDLCKCELPRASQLDIISHNCWSSLRLRVIRRYGIDYNVKEDFADLCQNCAIDTLETALKQVKAGVYASAETISVYPLRWDGKDR